MSNTASLLSPGVNEILQEKSISHSIYIQRYKTSVVNEMLTLLNQIDQNLQKKILLKTKENWTKHRLEKLLQEVKKIEQETYKIIKNKLRSEVHTFGIFETAYQSKIIQETVPIKLNIVQPAPDQLYAAVMAKPFEGVLLGEELADVSKSRQKKIIGAIRQGYADGSTTPQIVRRIFGSRAMQYKDSLLERSRKDVTALTRTALAHTAQVSREELYKKNEDLIKGEMIVATLDDKTTLICMNYDGKVFNVGEGPRPPYHWQCRSTTIPVIKSWRELGIDLDEAPEGTRASMNGQVPASMKYEEFLRGQDAAFQDDVLGKVKGQWFRDGISIKKFVDDGRILTLEEIAKREGLEIVRKRVISKTGEVLLETETAVIPKFKNVKEAAQWAVDHNLTEAADFGKVDLRIAQDWVNGIYYQVKEFPELKMEFIGSCQARNRLIKESYRKEIEDFWATVYERGSKSFKYAVQGTLNRKVRRINPNHVAQSCNRPGFKGVALNENLSKDYDAFIKMVEHNIDVGHWPKGKADVSLIVSHEMGHEIDRLLKIHSNSMIQELYLLSPNISKELSGYANANIGEMIAEAWAEYNTSPNPRPMAVKIGKFIEEEYQKWKK